MSRRHLRSSVLPALILLSLAAAPGCAGRLYEKGADAMEEQNTTEAIRYFQKAVKKDPEEAEYRFALGQAYVRAGSWNKAIESLTKAAELEPDRTDVLEQLAFAHVKAGNTNEAIEVYWRLFTLQKQSQSVFEKLRPLLESKERYPEVAEAAIAVSKQPKYDVNKLAEIGREYQRLGRLNEAEKLYKRALELKPRQAVWWRTLGEIRLRLDDGKGAAYAFEQAYTLDPSDTASAVGSAAALRRMGQINKAVQIYERVVATEPDRIDARAALVELYLAQGRLDEAEASAREVFIRNPEDAGSQALRGAVYLARGDYDKAIPALDRAERSEYASRPWVTRMLGDAFYGKGETASARNYYMRAINRNAEDGAAYLGLCRLDLDAGLEKSGMDRCKKAMGYAPELRDDAVEVMQAYYEQQGRVQKAEEVEQKAPPAAEPSRKKKPAAEGDAVAVVQPSRKDRLSDLKAMRDVLQQTDPAARTAREWYDLGDICWKLEDLEGAEKAFSAAWKAEQSNQQYHLRLAQALLARDNFDSAVVHLKDIVRAEEHNTAARYSLAEAYLARGSASDALEVLKELKELSPNDYRVYLRLADAYGELGMPDEAEKSQAMAAEMRKRPQPAPTQTSTKTKTKR
jgi:tetratricopeptide (TPR) repeat protein